jgi:hypothetical protein
MRKLWTRDFLMRRIDRCYLIAAWAKAAERRKAYLELARYYRRLLAAMSVGREDDVWKGSRGALI